MMSEGSAGSHRRAGGCCSITCAGDGLQSVPFISGGDRGALGVPVHVSSITPDQRPRWSLTLKRSQTCVACGGAAVANVVSVVGKGFQQVTGL